MRYAVAMLVAMVAGEGAIAQNRLTAKSPLTRAGEMRESATRMSGERPASGDGGQRQCLKNNATSRIYCLTRADWERVANGTLRLDP